MPIAMTDGTTYENELDKLFGDMDRAQQAQKRPGLGELEHKEKMADFESVAPPTDAHPTEMLGAYDASTKEENQLQPQMQADHNNPQNWGWKQIERQMNELIGETPGGYAQEGRDAVEFGITRGERTEQKVQATPEGKSTYEDLKGFYEGAPPDLVHPKAYENLQQVTPEQRKSLLWDTPIMSSKDPSMHEGDMESRFNHIDEALRESQDSMDQRWEQGKKDWNDLAAKDKRFKPTDPNEPGGPAGRVRMRFTPAARDYLENLPDDVDAIDMKDGTIVFQLKKALTSENDTLPLNARPTSAELPEEKSAYQNFTDKLEELSKKLNPSFIPTAEQFRDAPWKEKLGFIIASTFMFAGPGKGPKGNLSNPLESWKEGLAEFDKTEHPVINTLRQAEKDGSQTAANLLGEYRKIDDPTVRAEFSKIIKDKIMSASEGGETSPSNITNPQIDKEDFITRSNGRPYPKNIEQPTRSLTPDSPWGGEPITREDGSTFIGYDKKKLNQLERMWMNGNTYQEIADELNTSRGSVASMAKQMGLKRWDPRGENRTGKGTKDAEFSPEDLARGAAEGSEAGKPWSPAEDKVLKAWYADPNGDLAEIPNMLKHRSEQSIFNRARQKGYDQAQLPDESAKPFVPKGAVRAPEKGSTADFG
jgi:hypothetical protein